MDKVIQHRTGEVALRGDIYSYIIRADVELDLEDAIELTRIGSELTSGLKVGALVDARSVFSATNEARDYFSKNVRNDQFLAVAMVTHSLAQRLIINFYIKVNRPNVPTKIFENEEDAMKWLRTTLDAKK